MPIYEYYCKNCDGIFEERRPVSEASEPMPCPVCYKDAPRIMPTSFAAFTFRDGYPRRIPDDGKYYHFGHKVSKPLTRGRPNEHPEVNKPQPKPKLTKGELAEIREMRELAKRGELTDLYGNYVKPSEVRKMYEAGRILKKGTPKYGLPPEGPSS